MKKKKKKKNTLSQQLEAKSKHLIHKYMVVLKIKTVLIIVYFIGNLSFKNLYTFCHLSYDSFM